MRVEVAFEPAEAGEKLEVPPEGAGAAGPPERWRADLRENPGLLERLEEARRHPSLKNFLAAVNSADSLFSTVRCKTWLKPEGPATATAPGQEPCEFASQIDLVFAQEQFNLERSHYDNLTGRLQELLTRETVPDTMRAELRVRLCRFRALGRWGFGLAVFLYARGATAEQAQLRWGLGLARIQQALLFSSRVLRQQIAQAS